MTSLSNRTTSELLSGPLSRSLSADRLRHWMQDCRQSTLAMVAAIDPDHLCRQAHPEFSPIGWHLGHIAYTEALWLLERTAGLSPQFPDYRRLFAADSLPKAERVNLPTLAETESYLSTVRVQVFEYLERAPIESQERLWRWLLQHESQHGETIAIVLALLKNEEKTQESSSNSQYFPRSPSPISHAQGWGSAEMVEISAGEFDMGNESLDALDNERPVHRVYLPTYWIDRAPVTCGQYQQFMAAGGYHCDRWWSPLGWQWLQHHSVTQPRYWQADPSREHHPVCGVSWYEAEAYANFVGKRLPTEAEWEKAASWDAEQQRRLLYPWGDDFPTGDRANAYPAVGDSTPVTAHPKGNSPYGCQDLLGNVWEWTASWFDGYDGFTAYPYPGYSQTYFDRQHRVLKGGSWATRPWSMRCAFRNWYHPQVREIFAGFRCVR